MGRPRNALLLPASRPNQGTPSGLEAVEPRQPTVPFPDSVRKAFQEWIHGRITKTLFDSSKSPRYRWILDEPEAPVFGTIKELQINFNERHNALTHFVLKDNQLCRGAMKEGQRAYVTMMLLRW